MTIHLIDDRSWVRQLTVQPGWSDRIRNLLIVPTGSFLRTDRHKVVLKICPRRSLASKDNQNLLQDLNLPMLTQTTEQPETPVQALQNLRNGNLKKLVTVLTPQTVELSESPTVSPCRRRRRVSLDHLCRESPGLTGVNLRRPHSLNPARDFRL